MMLTFKYCNLQIGIGKDQSECFDLPNDHIDHGKKRQLIIFSLSKSHAYHP